MIHFLLDDGSKSTRSTVVETSFVQKTDSKMLVLHSIMYLFCFFPFYIKFVCAFRGNSPVKIIQLHLILVLKHKQKSWQVGLEAVVQK